MKKIMENEKETGVITGCKELQLSYHSGYTQY